MISQRAEPPIVEFSVRVYQALLVAYPTKFQQEYGSEMMQVFQDCCLRTVRRGGTNGMLKLWAVTLLDLVQSVISEHAQKEIQMKKEMKPEDIQTAGWALIVGAVVFPFGLLLGSEPFNLWALSAVMITFLSMPLLIVGLLGVRNRYGDKVGGFGKNILLTGVILGSLTSLTGLFGGVVDPFWILVPAGPAVLFACLALFGVVALYKKPLPRWNVLPLLAGAWFPIFFVPALIETFKGNWYPETANMAMPLIILQCIALSILGYVLKSDVPNETAAPA